MPPPTMRGMCDYSTLLDSAVEFLFVMVEFLAPARVPAAGSVE